MRDSRNRRQTLRQEPRVGVIVGQPPRRLFERDQSRRRQHARLPHAAAQPLAIAAGRCAISSAGPASIDPAGAPSAFERQNITVSTGAAISLHRHAQSPPPR